MSCVHDACRQGREVCNREACQVEEACAMPWKVRDAVLLFAGLALYVALELTIGVLG